jgi:hypothetical protein
VGGKRPVVVAHLPSGPRGENRRRGGPRVVAGTNKTEAKLAGGRHDARVFRFLCFRTTRSMEAR